MSSSSFPAWRFREMDAGEVHVDPVHDEFFKMQDLADALVRESVQNSLDARRGRSPVRVRFRFAHAERALAPEAAAEYLRGLRPHVDASAILSVLPDEGAPLPYLLIEDFGTRGLTGDPAGDPELDAGQPAKNDFFYFWRNVGRSSKGEIDRGRWGLGKAVFAVASRLRTIFGLTLRAEDGRSLLLGQSVLKTHVIGGVRIYPYGFFARFESAHGMPLPIEDALLLERFADDFALHRAEPGLSVVVPYYRDDELSFDRILTSAMRQYFYPITRGDLVVEVEDGSRAEVISARSIDEVAARNMSEVAGVAALTALTRWSLTEADECRIDLSTTGLERAPKWSEQLLPRSDWDALRQRFDSGQPVAIRAGVPVKRKKAKPVPATFDIVLARDTTLQKADVHFIRRGITIPDVRAASPDRSVRALVIVDHEALSTFLGDSENPAHSDWSERADKLKMTYEHHATTLRFVKNSAAFIASMLTRPAEGRVVDFLENIFSIERPGEDEPEAETGSRSGDAAQGETEARAGGTGATALPRMTIARIAQGFTIRGAGDPAIVARPFSVEIAYRSRTGNPFRRHSAFDFDVRNGDITLRADAAVVTPTAANAFRFIASAARFHITTKGFDARRDLVVRVVDDSGDASETELH